MRRITSEELRDVVARGWSTPENAHKVIDMTLVTAIAEEVGMRIVGIENMGEQDTKMAELRYFEARDLEQKVLKLVKECKLVSTVLQNAASGHNDFDETAVDVCWLIRLAAQLRAAIAKAE